MDTKKFDEYDLNKLKEAKRLLMIPLNYNYGDPRMKSKVCRLETIVKKLTELLNME